MIRKDVLTLCFPKLFTLLLGSWFTGVLSVASRLVGLVVKASASRLADPGFDSRLRRGILFFLSRVIPVTCRLALCWLPCQAPGVVGSTLGLVDLVSVYCGLGKFDVQRFSQCGSTYSCLSRPVPEIHTYVAGTLSNQQTTT